MAYNFEDFGLPENLHDERAPHKFWSKRTNRRSFLTWLAFRLGMLLPAESQDAWYQLTNQDIVSPVPGERPFGSNLLNWKVLNPNLRRHYVFVIMDAFPEVEWDIFSFTGKLNLKGSGHVFRTGYTLPHPDEEVISRNSRIITITGPDICRPYFDEIASRLGIANDNSALGWSQTTMAKITELSPPMPKWDAVRGVFSNSLYTALSLNFPEVGYLPWQVGGNGTAGFGNPDRVGIEQARADVRMILTYYVQTRFMLNVNEVGLDILYQVGQRGLNTVNGVCKNHYGGAPQRMIEFAYPEHDWDPTRFGQRKERQALAYHSIRSWLSEDELTEMDQQTNKGWEHDLSLDLGSLFPRTALITAYTAGSEPHYFGGSTRRNAISGDIYVHPRRLMVDVLGEDHTDPSLSRSNQRSEEDLNNRFHQRWVQDRQRWDLCIRNGIHVIAIGPNFNFTDAEVGELRTIVEGLTSGSPSFNHIGFPEDYELPAFGPLGLLHMAPPTSTSLGGTC